MSRLSTPKPHAHPDPLLHRSTKPYRLCEDPKVKPTSRAVTMRHRSLFRTILPGRLLEGPLARLSAEVKARALIHGSSRRPLLIHHHPADRILRHWLYPLNVRAARPHTIYRYGLNPAYLASMAALISGTFFPCLYMAYASSVMSWQMSHPNACRST